MVRIYTLALWLFAAVASIQAQTLFQVERNGLYGYKNAANDTVIAYEYIHACNDSINTLGFVFNSRNGKIICFNNKGERLFHVFNYDNGPDYIQEGLFRIEDENGLIGFADSTGNVAITPQFKFAFPFNDGKAKVTFEGELKDVPGSNGSKHYWDSTNWFYIDRQGFQIKQ